MCAKTLTWTQGVFCAKFYRSRRGFPACHHAACRKCYTSDPMVTFHVHHHQHAGAELHPRDLERLMTAWGKNHCQPNNYLEARQGENLMIPFECNLCTFWQVKNQNPRHQSPPYQLLLACLCQENLDSFWSRERNTAEKNTGQAAAMQRRMDLVEDHLLFFLQGGIPWGYQCGYMLVVELLLHLRQPGRNDLRYVQYDSVALTAQRMGTSSGPHRWRTGFLI